MRSLFVKQVAEIKSKYFCSIKSCNLQATGRRLVKVYFILTTGLFFQSHEFSDTA